MKPSFALNVTDDSISLLHRTSRGWLEVGKADLDDPDLPGALGYLRGSALGLEPRGFTTKLVIPNSQILYTTVEAPGPRPVERRQQIRAALEGRTPYAVSDLVFDWCGTGPEVQVAVIAKETLDEAEAFALEHRLNPVSFVALPDPAVFGKEPWFGMAKSASEHLAEGEKVERDQDPIQIIAREVPKSPKAAKAAEPAPAPKEERPAPPPADAAAKVADEAPKDDATKAAPMADAKEAPKEEAKAEPAPVAAKPEDKAPEKAPEMAPERAPAKAEPDATPDTGATEATAKPDRAAEPAAKPAQADAAATDTPPAKAAATPNGAIPPVADPLTDPSVEDDIPPPLPAAFASRRAAQGAAPALGGAGRPAPQPGATMVTSPTIDIPRPRAAPVPPIPTAAKPTKPGKARAASAPPPRVSALMNRTVPNAPPVPPAKTEAEAMTVFGERRSRVGGKPRFLGLILTALLLAFLAAVALWSTLYLSRNDTDPEPVQIAANPDAAPVDAILAADSTVLADAPVPPSDTGVDDPEALADGQDLASPEALLDLAAEPDMAPAEADTLAGTPALDPEAEADAALIDSPAPQAATDTAAAPEPAIALEATADPQTAEAPEAAEPVAEPVAEAPPPAPEPAPVDTAVTAEPTSTRNPVAEPLDEIFLAMLDPGITAKDPVALTPPDALAADAPPATQSPPPPYGTFYEFDANGMIRPTAEGVVTPEGVRLVAGPPPVVPPARPQTEPPEPAAATAAADPAPAAAATTAAPVAASTFNAIPELAGAKPRARPEGLGPDTADDASLAEPEVTRFASLRPRLRSAEAMELAEKARAAAQGATLSAAIATSVEAALQPVQASAAVSPLAVAVSRKPAARPRDFSKAVQAALAAAATPAPTRLGVAPTINPEEEDEPEPVRAAPSIPTRANVAKQATLANAINLSKTNLIGVYGTKSRRYALVRQSNGRFVKVSVGDRLDGGKVAAIGDRELQYVKNGRTVTLALPRG